MVADEAHRAPAPRFYLGRTVAGHVWRFRSQLPTQLAEQLAALCVNEPLTVNLSKRPQHFKAYMRLLEAQEEEVR
jgi:hypothetical protein